MTAVMTMADATRDLHHACERHPVGQRMVSGTVSRQAWADWLWAFRVLHQVVDPHLPAGMERDALLAADLSVLPVPTPSAAAMRFAASLAERDPTGAAYVLHGAHRSGGRVLAPLLARRGLPSAHVVYRDPDAVQAWVRWARGQDAFATDARETFAALLTVMDEIEARR